MKYKKIPHLLHEVHRLIEKRKTKFILTGSSARKLKKERANLLAGRALTYSMHPLTVVELGASFNLKHSLHYGTLPESYTYSNPAAYLASYIRTYLREEVQQEGVNTKHGSIWKIS